MEVAGGPDVFRQPSKFLHSVLTDLLHSYPEVERRDYQSCHGRLVQDICLETPHIKRSQYSQIKKALIKEEAEKNVGKTKPHNCFVKEDETPQHVDNFLFPDDEEILEMTDLDVVVDYKLERLVNLLRLSSRTLVFTRSALTSEKHYGTQCAISCLSETSPPFSYFGLSALEKHNLVHFWVQLGHDGMAAKAGFPPEKTVEVYDSWYGLAQNPYKKDTDRVEREATAADLVLVLCDDCEGATSDLLCSAALRSTLGRDYSAGGALGVVIVSRKRTARDCQATLKINCNPDDLIKKLIDRYQILEDVPREAMEDRLKYEARVTERSSVLSSLEEAVMYQEDDPRIHHGRLFSSVCLLEPQRTEAGLEDADKVLAYKLRLISDLIKLSGRTLVFTEGGLQAVTHSKDKEGHGHYGAKQCGMSHSHSPEPRILPTSYRVVSHLASLGLVHGWVQLGHDGLPQEAGSPLQVREIYDSWRSEEHDCYKEELTAVDTEIGKADLIIIFGHSLSLSGKTAQTMSDICSRDFQDLGQSLGLVIISDTRTHLDKFATVRVNSSPDLALENLVDMMDISSLPAITPQVNVSEAAEEVAVVGSSPDNEPSPDPDSGLGGEGSSDLVSESSPVKEVTGAQHSCADSSHRAFIADALTQFKVIDAEDPRIFHGRMLSETCLEEPQQSEDLEHTKTYKLEKLIDLVKLSKKTVFCVDSVQYGAELSDQTDPCYCILNNLDSEAKKKLSLLSFLNNNSMVEFVFQVGHDGILQRAGFLSNNILEFFDPSSEEVCSEANTDMIADNADLLVFATDHIEAPIFKRLVRKLSENSKTGLKYEDGGYVVVGTNRTSLDAEATLKINSKPSSTVSDLVTKLEIGELTVSRVGRACSGPEHRNLLHHMMKGSTADEESLTSHGKMVRDLPGPFETTSSKEVVLYQEDLSSLNYKLLLLNLLLRGSKRTMVLSEASQGQVFMAGASYGAKCGMSDPDNLPSSLHYQLVSLHHHGLLHVWAQHGHDGLPQRAGFSPEDVVEVYNSWFDLPENPHNLEIEKLKTEASACDLVVVLEPGDCPAERGSVTRQTVINTVLGNTHNLGLVMISRSPGQETKHSVLNIYSEPGDLLPRLLRSLDIVTIPSTPRNVCCLHRAQAMVPYDRQGRRTSAGKMMLSLEVGDRVKLSPSHDHKLIPAYTTVRRKLSDVQKKKLSCSGPKYGSVTRLLPEKCAFEIRLCGVPILLGAWWLDAAAKGIPPTIPFVNCNSVKHGGSQSGLCDKFTRNHQSSDQSLTSGYLSSSSLSVNSFPRSRSSSR